jgi:hypothetical protein
MASLKTAMLFAALKDAGVTRVEIRYDGGGDSGQVDDVEFEGDNIDVRSIHDKFEGDLQELGCHILEQHYNHDWYNNDGGYGSIVINLTDSPTIDIDGYVRTTEEAYDSVNLESINWKE